MVITLFLILKTGTQNWTPYQIGKLDIRSVQNISRIKQQVLIVEIRIIAVFPLVHHSVKRVLGNLNDTQ